MENHNPVMFQTTNQISIYHGTLRPRTPKKSPWRHKKKRPNMVCHGYLIDISIGFPMVFPYAKRPGAFLLFQHHHFHSVKLHSTLKPHDLCATSHIEIRLASTMIPPEFLSNVNPGDDDSMVYEKLVLLQ